MKELSDRSDIRMLLHRIGQRTNAPIEIAGARQTHPSTDLPFGLGRVIGQGSVPGCVGEIFGRESTGKSTLVLQLLAHAQRAGMTALLIDSDHALVPEYAEALGVDLARLLLLKPRSAEEATEAAYYVAGLGNRALIALDSFPSLFHSLDAGIYSETNRIAAFSSVFLPKLCAQMDETGSLMIFTNQLRVTTAFDIAPREVTPGGRALRHYASFRLKLRRLSSIDGAVGRVSKGFVCRITIVKNKLSTPGRAVDVDCIDGRGFVDPARMLDAIGADDGISMLPRVSLKTGCAA